jgi:hypothetical protein
LKCIRIAYGCSKRESYTNNWKFGKAPLEKVETENVDPTRNHFCTTSNQWRRQGFWCRGQMSYKSYLSPPSSAATTFFWRPLPLAPGGNCPLLTPVAPPLPQMSGIEKNDEVFITPQYLSLHYLPAEKSKVCLSLAKLMNSFDDDVWTFSQ